MFRELRYSLLLDTNAVPPGYEFAGTLPERLVWNSSESSLELEPKDLSSGQGLSIALYSREARHIIIVHLWLVFPPEPNGIQITFGSVRMEEAQEESPFVRRFMNLVPSDKMLESVDRWGWEANIVANKVFNHVMYMLTVRRKDWGYTPSELVDIRALSGDRGA
ncbi:hypothetical protein K458DRAFT_423761 [Lentithecium fluviatile CBS 122367]|uniref:Uncharacterized protein n=1 Tax=Lentithecium fluviatile CBS 122367 TaxID=1168545 RepID=A0A6G1IHY4_9PLEO|nr:hypothetical protein K458DRAFT_423761 [Lentithecium fluviatile CBS 122367]